MRDLVIVTLTRKQADIVLIEMERIETNSDELRYARYCWFICERFRKAMEYKSRNAPRADGISQLDKRRRKQRKRKH